MKIYFRYIYILILLLGFQLSARGQQSELSGKVIDKDTKEPLIGVNITIKDKLSGTITDTNGKFNLKSQDPPFTLVFSYIGYAKQEYEITGSESKIDVQMVPEIYFGEEIIVSASRIEENILQSSVSIEKLSIKDIQQSPGANFYDGLYQLKGVDMNVHSLTFRFPNTRGFNNENNYRLNQIVDGVENISPGLSFAAGNIFGLSQLDAESVELIVGASSALYGPGGMNGTLLMTSKNPFEYQGLSVSAQTGVMHLGADYKGEASPMYDLNMRYAKSFNDKVAIKLTASYLTATDWYANDYRDRADLNDPTLTRATNEGYDGVNVYGDDIIVPVNLKDIAPNVAEEACKLFPVGSPEYQACYNNIVSRFPDQVVSRTGWVEEDLVDYNTKNLRLNGAVHYRITEKLEAVADLKYSEGTSVYTAQNRFSIRDFGIYTGKLELKSPDFYVRAWGVKENTGDTYDAGTTALLMNEAWKPSQDWYADYIAAFTENYLTGKTLEEAYNIARIVADNRDRNGNVFDQTEPAFPLAGTEEFNTLFNDISSRSITEGGSKVIDKSSMWQIEGMYNLSRYLKFVELLVGASYRNNIVNSDGTVFYDTPGNPIRVYQFGSFAQLSKDVFSDHLKITASARFDKNEMFAGKFTPRVSMVYSPDQLKLHNFRASYQTAFRFPSISDQWVNFNAGPFIALGGLPEVQALYNFKGNPVYPLTGSNPITDKPYLDDGPFLIPPFTPETVIAMEVGYKGLYFNRMLFVDTYFFKNIYNGFLAYQLLTQNPNTPQEQRYQTIVSTDDPVSSLGWAIGADLRLMKGFFVRGNVAYNSLESGAQTVGFQSRFNTPDYRLNFTVGNREFIKDIGFSVNMRWQNSFVWESNFGTGEIPAYYTLDANFSYKIPSVKSVIKIGGSNIINNYYTTSFGAAQVGGLYYISWTFDNYLN